MFVSLTSLACASAPPAALHHGAFHKRFQGATEWPRIFDDPARDAWQRPEQVLDALALPPDARVADLGAGTGYFSVRLARRLPRGQVFAVDVDMVRYLEQRAQREGLSNLRAVKGTSDDAQLPERVDLVLVVDTYHHIAERTTYFRKLAAALRPGGRLAIIDFTREAPMGPPAEHRIPPQVVAEELVAAGFVALGAQALLPHQYFLLFLRPQ